MNKTIFACVALALSIGVETLRADTVVFKNGEEIDGTVIEKDENMIKLQVEFGTVVVPMARVRRIEADTPERIEERKKKKEAAEALAKEMKGEGKVLYKGKWVTEDDKKVAEEKVAEARKKKQALEAEVKKKAEAAAAKAKEDADKAAADLAQNTSNTREDRFSRRHGRDGLTNDTFNQNNNGTSSYNSNVISNNGMRGGR